MNPDTGELSPAQPVGLAAHRILLSIIHTASPADEQKELIMIAREMGAIADGECERIIAGYGLLGA